MQKKRIINLEQAGWKRVCPISESYIKDIKRVLRMGEYNTVESDDYLLCEPLTSPLSSPRKLIYISNYLDKYNYSEWKNIIFSRKNFVKNQYIKFHGGYIEDPENFRKRFLEKSGVKSFRALRSLTSMANPSQILNVLYKYVVPAFFEKYPEGRIYFITYSDLLASMNGVARVLSDADIFGIDIFKKSKDIKKEIPRSMRKAHQPGFDAFIESSFGSILWGFFPFIYGFVASRLGGYIIFLLDKPIKNESNKSIYQELKGDSIFSDLDDQKSTEELLDLVKKKDIDYRIAYRRYSHKVEFSLEEMDQLISWTIQRLNDFYIKILDFCNFYNNNDFIDFAHHRKVFLTLERIFMEIEIIIFSIDPYARKILYFDLHDKISNLMVTKSLKRDKVFMRLLRLSHFKRRTTKVLQNLPSPFNLYLKKYGEELYNALINSSIEYIWDKSRKTSKGIQLREVDCGHKNEWIGRKYKDSLTKIPEEEYSINLLHTLRNTLHGYALYDYNFEKYLAIHEGGISDYLPDLSLIWLFIMLDDIIKVLNSDIVKMKS